jgi:hypothetical protein
MVIDTKYKKIYQNNKQQQDRYNSDRDGSVNLNNTYK